MLTGHQFEDETFIKKLKASLNKSRHQIKTEQKFKNKKIEAVASIQENTYSFSAFSLELLIDEQTVFITNL